MSISKMNPSYCNSLSSLHQSRGPNQQSEPLISLKEKKVSNIYKFICCLCIPTMPTATRKLSAKSSVLKKQKVDSCEQFNNNTTFMENSKLEEHFKSTKFIQTLKTKSHFAINEILTPTELKSKKNCHFNLKTSQVMKRNRSEENLAEIISSTFPKNQIYFLKFGEKYLLARNLHWHFKNVHNYSQHLHLSICNDQQSDSFSTIKSKCLKYDSESIILSDPECVAKRLAKKLKSYQTVVEFGCGAGNLTIHLARKCSLVYAVDHHHSKLLYADYNTRVSGLQDKIIITEGDSLRHVKVTPDLIFLNPEWEMRNKFLMESHLVSFQNMSPDIFTLLEDSLKLSQNIAIVLPKCININEFAYILSKMEEKNLLKGNKYSMEFEYIHLNNKLWKIYAFIGQPNTITHHEEIEFISAHLNEDIDCEVLFKENTTLLKQIDSKIGIRTITRILPDILSKDYGHNKTLTFFQKFLDELKSRNLISNCDMSEILSWVPEKTKRSMPPRLTTKPTNKTFSRDQSSVNLLKKNDEKSIVLQEEYCRSEFSSYDSDKESEKEYNRESFVWEKNYKSFKMDGNPRFSRQRARNSFN